MSLNNLKLMLTMIQMFSKQLVLEGAEPLKESLANLWWFLNPTHEQAKRSCTVQGINYAKDNKSFYLNTNLGNLQGVIIIDEEGRPSPRLSSVYNMSKSMERIHAISTTAMMKSFLGYLAQNGLVLSEPEVAQKMLLDMLAIVEAAEPFSGAKVMVVARDETIIGQLGPRSWVYDGIVDKLSPELICFKFAETQNGYAKIVAGPLSNYHLFAPAENAENDIPEADAVPASPILDNEIPY